MIRATSVRAAGSWTGDPVDTVVLDCDERHRRRTAMEGVRGLAFLLDLPEAVMLRGGDALELEDGRVVEIVSAPEALIEIRGSSPRDLVRLGWHIGNRHLPAQILANAIRIRSDHVIEEMLRGLGARVVAIEAPFDPEGGAYASGGTAGPDHATSGHRHYAHGHDDGHKHEHDHHHGHRHESSPKHGHDH